ncbi:hypothetical protein A7K91_02070 [Paenibacillus oryzae]|uniref:Uncharacterized protein n=1 Tax=Paenibacillus oryzae TaxID=1844972 RepID=A0A1A5YAL7_9BACL|nr:hypothetical protein A7K91_02070 [Paenibacillus oryzae]
MYVIMIITFVYMINILINSVNAAPPLSPMLFRFRATGAMPSKAPIFPKIVKRLSMFALAPKPLGAFDHKLNKLQGGA